MHLQTWWWKNVIDFKRVHGSMWLLFVPHVYFCCIVASFSNSLVSLNYSMVAFSLNSFGLLWWIWVTKKSSSTRVGLPREFMKFVRSQSKSPYDYKLALKFCRRPLSKLLGSIQILVFTYFFQCIYVVVWPK